MSHHDDDYDYAGLIENKGDHKYLRRIPWPGRKKKYRYVYDPRLAAQLPVKPSPGEKVRVPHGAQAGHYEILAVKRYGSQTIVDMQHDETGHRMYADVDDLHKLVQEVFTAPPPPPPAPVAKPVRRRSEQSVRKAATQALERLRKEHERADALPRERWRVLDIILDDNRIQDYDLSKRDYQYLAWQRGEAKKPGPLPEGIGLLDSFMSSGGARKTRFCCLREAFNHAIVNAKTWRDIEPAIDMLRTVNGFDQVCLPAFVLEQHGNAVAEMRDAQEALQRGEAVPQAEEPPPPPLLPDYTRYGVLYDAGREEADMLLDVVTRRGRPAPAAERDDFLAFDEDDIIPF